MAYEIRPAGFRDIDGVNELMVEAGFKTRSPQGWDWLHRQRPGRAESSGELPIGWVLAWGEDLHGFLGNQPLDYAYKGVPIRAATSSSYYVRPEARRESVKLMSAFFRQPDIDLFMTTTANDESEPVYRMFKSKTPADECFSEGYVWMADDRAVLTQAVDRIGTGRGVLGPLAKSLSPAVRAVRRATRYATPPPTGGNVMVLEPEEMHSDFDTIGKQLNATGALLINRNAAALRWYMADPDSGATPLLVAAFDDEGLAGYGIGARHQPRREKLAHLRLLDLVVRPGAENMLGALVHRLVTEAEARALGAVYCPPTGAQLAPLLRKLRPHIRRHHEQAHYLRTADASLADEMVREGVWHATGLDGDTPFLIRNDGAEQPSG